MLTSEMPLRPWAWDYKVKFQVKIPIASNMLCEREANARSFGHGSDRNACASLPAALFRVMNLDSSLVRERRYILVIRGPRRKVAHRPAGLIRPRHKSPRNGPARHRQREPAAPRTAAAAPPSRPRFQRFRCATAQRIPTAAAAAAAAPGARLRGTRPSATRPPHARRIGDGAHATLVCGMRRERGAKGARRATDCQMQHVCVRV